MASVRRLTYRLLCLVALLLMAGGCKRLSDRADEVHMTSGWRVDPEPLVTIGQADGHPDYLFARISAVRLLPDGRVAVADESDGSIRIYGSDGVLQRRMGGIGRGPGEFTHLSTLALAPPDTIAAYDSRALRLTKFLTTGELVSTHTFDATGGYPEVFVGTYSDGSHALAWIEQMPRDPGRVTADVMRIGRFARDGRLSHELDRTVGMRRLGSPIPFSGHFLATMVGDTIFHTDGHGEIVVVGPRAEPLRNLDPAIAGWEFAEARRRLEVRLGSAASRRIAGLADVAGVDSIPRISDLLVARDGRLWLKRYEPSTDSHWVLRLRTGGEWFVVETDGSILARVSMPAGVRLMDVSGERIAGIARDELGVERVQVFAIGGRVPPT